MAASTPDLPASANGSRRGLKMRTIKTSLIAVLDARAKYARTQIWQFKGGLWQCPV